MTQFPKTIFNFVTKFVTLFSFVALVTPSAYATPQQKMAGEIAQRMADGMNQFGTVGNYLKGLERYTTKEEMDKTVKLLQANGVTKATKIPKLKVDGNKIYYDKANYMIINSDGTISSNGVKFKSEDIPFDQLLAKIYSKLGGKKSAQVQLIPEANAFFGGGVMGMLLGGALMGLGLWFVGKSAGWWGQSSDTVVAPATATDCPFGDPTCTKSLQ